MSTIICDFMSDSYLEDIAEKLCSLRPAQFSHLLAHRKPSKEKKIGNLIFLDATQLYRHENLSNCFNGLSISSVNLEQSKQLAECQTLFTSAFDRTAPIPNSAHYVHHLFWDLVGYYISFFNENKTVDSVLFDNTPHLPWDICLFFVAKMLNIKVFFLRKTGMRGYVYIDEDFRPTKGNWRIDYVGLVNPLKTVVNKVDFHPELEKLSFSIGQVDGMWPEQINTKSGFFLKLKNILKRIGLASIIRFAGVILKKPLNNYSVASQSSSQRTVLAGMNFVNKWNFINIYFSYVKALKSKIKLYNKLASNHLELNKPFVYFSLHLQPERTTMPEGLIYDDQILAIRTLSKALPNGWKILVKEHPRQMQFDIRSTHGRSCLDYERLNVIDNVEIVPLDHSQRELVQKCKCTATISGSVSWEGLLLGKPSLIFSENWHSDCGGTFFISSVEEAKDAFLKLTNISESYVQSSLCTFIRDIHKYLINTALNGNHLRLFFNHKDESVALNNISSAILQRLENK